MDARNDIVNIEQGGGEQKNGFALTFQRGSQGFFVFDGGNDGIVHQGIGERVHTAVPPL